MLTQVFLAPIFGRKNAKTADFKGIDFAEQLLYFLEWELQLGCELGFGRMPAQLEPQLIVSFLQHPRLPPQVTGAPVHLPQAVENSSANAELCIGTELHAFVEVKLLKCIYQSQDARVHQVLEGHVPGETLVDAPGDVTDLWKLLR